MPPREESTQWIEVHDFTPGLWTRDQHLAPPGSASEMNRCYPLPQGGLSPFVRLYQDYERPSGMGSGEYTLGYYYQPGLGGGTEFVMSVDTSDDSLHLYKRENDFPDGAWTEITTGMGSLDWLNGMKVTFVGYALSSGGWSERTYFSLSSAFGGGVYKIDGTTVSGVYTSEKASNLVVHQDRLVAGVATDYTTTTASQLRFTDPGGESFTGSIEIPRGAAKGIAFIQSYSPSDLVVFLDDGPTMLIQGDLADPIIRLMDWSQPIRPGGIAPGLGTVGSAITPHGVAYQVPMQGVYVTRDGSSYNEISGPVAERWDGGGLDLGSQPAIDRFNSDLVYYDDFLFYGNASLQTDNLNRPKAYDFRTSAWFDVDPFARGAQILGRHQDHVVAWAKLSDTPPFDIMSPSYIKIGDLRDPTTRDYGWFWVSTPFRSPDSQQVEFRQVELNVYCIEGQIGSNTFDISVQILDPDDNSLYFRAVTVGPGSHKLVFPMAVHADYLRVKLTTDTNQITDTCAPILESMRIGYRPLHRRYRSFS